MSSSWAVGWPGWSQQRTRQMAVEAMTAAVKTDDALKETLREKIGMSVDRDQVNIQIGLESKEPGGA